MNDPPMPKIQIIVATKSAEAGINGKCLEFGKMNGLPSNFYELLQQLGRIGRSSGQPGSNIFEVHLDFNSVVSIVVRIMKIDEAAERQIQMEQLLEVLKFLVLPTECYHSGMEKKFEWKQTAKEDCGNYCSKCRDEVAGFTKRVHKRELQSLLTKQVRGTDSLSVRNFVKAMKQSRKSIFHDDDAPPTGQESQIHAVCLQLFAAGMIAFKINDERKLGTEKVCAGDLSIICPNVEVKVGGRKVCLIGYQADKCWKGFNLC